MNSLIETEVENISKAMQSEIGTQIVEPRTQNLETRKRIRKKLKKKKKNSQPSKNKMNLKVFFL